MSASWLHYFSSVYTYVSASIDFFVSLSLSLSLSLSASEWKWGRAGGWNEKGEESAVKCTHICIDQNKMRCVYTLVPLDVWYWWKQLGVLVYREREGLRETIVCLDYSGVHSASLTWVKQNLQAAPPFLTCEKARLTQSIPLVSIRLWR